MAGIVAECRGPDQKLPGVPGLGFLKPINSVVKYLEYWQEEEMRVFLYAKCGD